MSLGENKIHIVNLPEEVFLSGDAIIKYIKPLLEKRSQINQKTEEYPETWKDTAFKIGCLGLVGLFLISSVVGFIAIVNWVIN